MTAALAPYLRLVRAGFQQAFAYRAAMLAGVVANGMFGLLRGAIYAAMLASSGGALAGYSSTSLSTYNWLTQAMLGVAKVWPTEEIAERVRTGDIAVDFARPIDIQFAYLARDLGDSAAQVLPRAVPTLAIGALTYGVTFPTDPVHLALGLIAVVIGCAVSYLARFLLQLSAFWITDLRGLLSLYVFASGFLGGLVVPVSFMPGWLQAVAWATPFPSMLQLPVDVLSGRRADAAELGAAFAIQVAWLIGLLLAGRLALRRGHRALVVQGG